MSVIATSVYLVLQIRSAALTGSVLAASAQREIVEPTGIVTRERSVSMGNASSVQMIRAAVLGRSVKIANVL